MRGGKPLGARRSVAFSDTDFHNLDVTQPIVILATLDGLPDQLLNLDAYGDFLRGFDPETGRQCVPFKQSASVQQSSVQYFLG